MKLCITGSAIFTAVPVVAFLLGSISSNGSEGLCYTQIWKQSIHFPEGICQNIICDPNTCTPSMGSSCLQVISYNPAPASAAFLCYNDVVPTGRACSPDS